MHGLDITVDRVWTMIDGNKNVVITTMQPFICCIENLSYIKVIE